MRLFITWISLQIVFALLIFGTFTYLSAKQFDQLPELEQERVSVMYWLQKCDAIYEQYGVYDNLKQLDKNKVKNDIDAKIKKRQKIKTVKKKTKKP